MQRKDLALRVLSTATFLAMVASCTAPAFADVYYIGNGSIDVETKEDTDGKYVLVTQGDKTYEDRSNEIVIKDGTSEKNATLKESDREEGTRATPAVDPAATAATRELEAAGPAAGESQPDPDAAFTLSEAEEDSAQNQEGKDTTENPTENPTANPTEDTPKPSTENPTENPKKDVVYEYAPAVDPEPEKPATKLAPTTSADPTAETKEVTLDDAPAAAPTATTPAAGAVGSADNPTTNVIKVVNNWVGSAARELKIRLSNVNIKVGNSVDKAAMDVSGGGKTKIELDGQNALDSSATSYQAGLRKQGEGTLTITDETDDTGNQITAPKSGDSGSLTAKGGGSNDAAGIGKAIGGAGIGGKIGESTKNIIIEGYATVDAAGGGRGAGIGGGGGTADHGSGSVSGDAENIIIQGHSKVTATAQNGAAIGGGSTLWSKNGCYVGGSAKGIVIRDHATVVAKGSGISGFTGYGAAIGAAGGSGNNTEAEVTIGTPGATVEQEDVHVTATGLYGSAIGNGAKDTKVTIQGHVTIQTASSQIFVAIGSMKGNVEVNINDNVAIDTDDAAINVDPDRAGSTIGGGHNESGRTVIVNIDGRDDGRIEIGAKSALTGFGGIISGTEVNIGDNVLLKMKLLKYVDSKYINVNNAEAEVGKRSNPTAGGLVNTIGDNTQLWYTDSNGVLQKIVHSKNLCKKELVGETAATCTTPGSKTYKCTFESFESNNSAVDPEHTEQWTENTAIDPNAHDWGEWQVTTRATCTTKGVETRYCNRDHSHVETRTTPALGHNWVDNGDGTHTCTKCGATEGQPVNTNSALELRVVDAEGMDQPFTVSQNGTLRTYTGAYDTATLTGDLDTLRYLQDHGAQTIQFVTNGQTSSFAINDLLAQGSGSEVFYLTHRGAEEPTLLLVEADHSDLVKD